MRKIEDVERRLNEFLSHLNIKLLWRELQHQKAPKGYRRIFAQAVYNLHCEIATIEYMLDGHDKHDKIVEKFWFDLNLDDLVTEIDGARVHDQGRLKEGIKNSLVAQISHIRSFVQHI